MTDKELKRLNRAELLELLLVQTKETERLQKKLEKTEAALSDRQLQIQNAGDLAHAVLEINGVMEAAQAAAQQYLENMEKMEEQIRPRCEKMLEEAGQEAQRIRAEAEQIHLEAQRIRGEADQLRAEAEQIRMEAEQIRAEAERIRSEAATVSTAEIKTPSADDLMMEEFYKLIRE